MNIMYKTNLNSERWREEGRRARDLEIQRMTQWWAPWVFFLPHVSQTWSWRRQTFRVVSEKSEEGAALSSPPGDNEPSHCVVLVDTTWGTWTSVATCQERDNPAPSAPLGWCQREPAKMEGLRKIQNLITRYENVQVSIKKLLIIQEPWRSQTESKKTISSCQHWDDREVRVSDKDFKAAVIRMLQRAIMNTLKQMEKIRIYAKNIFKEEPNGKFWT